MDQKTPNGPRLRLGGAPSRGQSTRARQEAQARPGGLCPPRVPPGPPLCSINTPIFPEPQGSRRNIHPAAAESRTTRSNLDTITEGFIMSIGASPMMREQFFVDLRVRSWQLDGFLSLVEFSIQWSLGDPYDVTLFVVCLLGSDELRVYDQLYLFISMKVI